MNRNSRNARGAVGLWADRNKGQGYNQAGPGKYVAIENQTKERDHDHTGKALTYAAGLEARFVVWIAADFRDEYRAAIDWLNRMTTDEVDFFGVRVAAVKIEDSPPAALFTVAAAPNEWTGQVKDTLNSPSARQEQYGRFWEPLLKNLNETRGWRVSTDNRKSRYDAGSGFTARFGNSGVGAVAGYFGRTMRLTQNAEARVEWNIQSRVPDWNKEMFDQLLEHRKPIESEIRELEWERLDGATMSRIAAFRIGTIDDGEESLEEIRQWMLETVNGLPDVMEG